MNCPFLRETRVRYCRRAPVRKLIPLPAGTAVEERCSTERFVECALYAAERGESGPPCPLLHESLVQYCAASPVTHFVPYSEAVLSRCGAGAFSYCDLFLQLRRAGAHASSDGIAVEPALLYTANHWWVDLPDEGPSHIGIDAFLARLLGEATRIDYATNRPGTRPAASVSAGGTDWQLSFPEPFDVTRCNLYLRGDPGRLTAQPYTQGWLFEGGLPAEAAVRLRRECRVGERARAWMAAETQAVGERLQQIAGVAADGGLFSPGVLAALGRGDAAALFHQFCSPVRRTGGED